MKIFPWDWHYRVGFDADLRERVSLGAASLVEPFASTLREELAAYSQFVSVEALIDAVAESPAAADQLVSTASIARPAYLIENAVGPLESRISQIELSSSIRQSLRDVIHRAAKSPYVNLNRQLFEPVFGQSLSSLLAYKPDEEPRRMLSTGPRMAARRQVCELLINHRAFVERHYRDAPTIEFEIEERVGDGHSFAEYWSAELLASNADKLILYDHAMGSDLDEQNATLVHEVIGHGFFYKLAARTSPSFVDHGALAFVEGWATAVEWELSPPQYVRYYLAKRARALQLFDERDPRAIQASLAKQYAESGLASEQVRIAVGNYFQYPGYAYSYSLGGLWFRQQCRRVPFSFFMLAAENPWGNFFANFKVTS